jgi:Family of unknown function (DUF6200)
MTRQASAAEQAGEAETKKSRKPLVVVELSRRRSPEQVRRLRKGRGKLVSDIDEVVDELVDAGTIKADTPPVVVVVREASPPLLLPDYDYDEDDDDEDDDEDEDEDEDEDDEDDD